MLLSSLFYGKCEETNDSPNEEALSSDKGEDTDKAQCRQDCDAQSNMDEDDDFVYVCGMFLIIISIDHVLITIAIDNQVFATKCAMDRVACDRCNKCKGRHNVLEAILMSCLFPYSLPL